MNKLAMENHSIASITDVSDDSFSSQSFTLNETMNETDITEKQNIIKTTTTKKRVHFGECTVVGYVSRRDELTKTERENSWYEKSDFLTFKSNAKQACVHITNHDNIGCCILDIGYEKSQYLALTFNNEEDDNENKLYKILQDIENNKPCTMMTALFYKSWTIKGYRGLEHTMSKLNVSIRQEIVKQSKLTVLSIQNNESTKEIAEQYANVTRASRIMARWFGYTDQLLQQQLQKQQEQQIAIQQQQQQQCSTPYNGYYINDDYDDNLKSDKKKLQEEEIDEHFHSGGSLTMRPIGGGNTSLLSQYFGREKYSKTSSGGSSCTSSNNKKSKNNNNTKFMGIIPKFRK